jgi:hypothetical protein
VSDRSRAVRTAHGVTGLCRYYASIAAYLAWQRIRETSNTIRYRLARRDPLRVCLFTGRSIRLPRNDGGIGIELMSGIREPAATRYLQTFLRDDDVVIDIGANIGYYVAVERYAAPGAEIHAIEPVLANLSLLLENTPRQVKVYLCGVEGAEREGSLRKGGGESGAPSSLSRRTGILYAGGGPT